MGPASPQRPLALLDAPGPALLRQNLSWLRVETNPLPTHLERVVRGGHRAYCLFDLDALPAAIGACAFLSSSGLSLSAVRGRTVPEAAVGAFAELSFERGLLPLLSGEGELPERWKHPVVLARAFHPEHHQVLHGVVFSRLPEPGVRDWEDLGRDGAREGAPSAALPQDTTAEELRALLIAFERAGARGAVVADNGGPAAELALTLLAERRLGGWFGPARRPVPEAVRASGVPVYTWFEPEDLGQAPPPVASGCAFMPAGLADEDPAQATATLLSLRERGYGAVVPRYFTPVPNTAEWDAVARRYPLRAREITELDGRQLPFAMPAYGDSDGVELRALWMRDNRWPPPAPWLSRPEPRRYSFKNVRQVLDEYLADAQLRATACHARDLMGEVLDAVGGPGPQLSPLDEYPFVAWHGRNLYDLVQEAIQARLRSFDDAPEPLLQAAHHAALGGGKRIRPILSLAIAGAQGVPLRTAMPAALVTEWLHTASLIQDDLPCMDDDSIRRRQLTSHLRYGEGMALLASDALVALAFQDLAELADDPDVGPSRSAAMIGETSRTIGLRGLVGGQARDLLTRRQQQASFQEVLEVHRAKTAPLFRLSAALAVTLAGTPEPLAAELKEMLFSVGLAFQIVDDALDATPGNEAFGRPAGSDSRNHLPTFATLMGAPAARRYAQQVMAPHLDLDQRFPAFFGLSQLARFLLERRQ